jgi:hypothetical protein
VPQGYLRAFAADSKKEKIWRLSKLQGEPDWHAVCNDFPGFTWPPLRKMVALLAATTWLRNPKRLDLWQATHPQFKDKTAAFDPLPSALSISGRRYDLDQST